jgi:hypothetical protein
MLRISRVFSTALIFLLLFASRQKVGRRKIGIHEFIMRDSLCCSFQSKKNNKNACKLLAKHLMLVLKAFDRMLYIEGVQCIIGFRLLRYRLIQSKKKAAPNEAA